jgi:hypothetical protein
MAKKRTTRTAYRDSKTGRFTSKKTYNHSKAHGGQRYKPERIKKVQLRRPATRPAFQEQKRPAIPSVFEWIVSFSYSSSGRSFDVIVTAKTPTEAKSVAKQFLREDIDGQRIARSNFRGWTVLVAKGDIASVTAGNAEYRSKSRAKRKKRPT